MGTFTSLASAAGDALGALAAAEIETAADVDELGIALATVLEDCAYMVARLADKAAGTALSPAIVERFYAAAAGERANAAYVSADLGHPLVTRAP